MSAVTRVSYFLSALFSISILTACSGGGESSQSDGATGRIVDSQNSTVEGDSGNTSTLTITFEAPVSGLISYSTFNITAAEKSDYTSISGEMNVDSGQEYSIDIEVFGDNEIEGDELVGIALTQNGAEVGEFYGRIINDDFPAINISTTSVLEGDAGTSLLRFVVELENETVDSYEFSITTPVVSATQNDPDQSIFYAIPDADFQAVDQTISFEEGVSEVGIEIVVYADNIIELDELVLLKALPVGLPDSAAVTATGIIRTDDSVDSDGFDLSGQSGTQDEGNDENQQWYPVTYPITINNPQNIIENQIVQISLEGSAENEGTGWATLQQDYCANQPVIVSGSEDSFQCDSIGSYQLEPNTESLNVTFYVKADLEVEAGDEDILVKLQNDQGVVFGQFLHTINEDDFPTVMVTYEIEGQEPVITPFEDLINTGIQVLEGDEVNIPLSVQFSLQYSQDDPFTLPYEIANDQSTTIDGSDYSLAPDQEMMGVVEIAPGQTEGLTLNLTIQEDNNYESTEIFTIELEGIGVLPVSVVDSDVPGLELRQTDGNPIVPDGDFESITLLEEDGASSSSIRHEFRLVLEESLVALSDFEFRYGLDETFVTRNQDDINNATDCGYLYNSSQKRIAGYGFSETENDQLDYRVYINGVLTEPGDITTLSQGQSRLDLAIEIQDDSSVECIEYVPLDFVLKPSIEGAEEGDPLNRVFAITNQDRTTLQVEGWVVSEGSSDLDPLPTTNTNFEFTLGQALSAEVTYNLTGSGLSCANDDIANLANQAGLSLNGIDTSFQLPVNIAQDTIVEPTETCLLEVTNIDADFIDLEYTYLGTPIENATNVSGVINNDDILTFTLNTSDTTEPADNEDPISIGSYTWDKDIAANVGEITFTITQNNCQAGNDCIEDGDTSLDIGSVLDIEVHTGLEGDTLLQPTTNIELAIYVDDDSEVENTEVSSFTIANTAGSEYSYDVQTPDRTIEIANTDKLTLQVNELTGVTVLTNEGEAGSKSFAITWGDKSVAADVPSLDLNLSNVNSALHAVRKTDELQEPVDYEFIIQKEGSDIYGSIFNLKAADQSLSADGNVQLDLILIDDDLVETPETIDISLSTAETDFLNPLAGDVSPNGKVTHNIGVDDQLEVWLSLPAGYNNTEPEAAQSINYAVNWRGDVVAAVPGLNIDVSHDGDATRYISNGATPYADYRVTIPLDVPVTDNTLTIKAAGSSLTDDSFNYWVNINQDDLVELDEELTSVLSNSVDTNSATYIRLLSDSSENQYTNISYQIDNNDYPDFQIEQLATVDGILGESNEVDTKTLKYSLSWQNPIGELVPSPILSLPFLGADLPDDYQLSVDADSAGRLTINTSNFDFTVIKDTDAVLNQGSVEFLVAIQNDTAIESDETLTAELTSYAGMPTYLTFGADKSLAHTILSEDGLPVTLSQTNTTTSFLERSSESVRESTFKLEWDESFTTSDDFIPFVLSFSGSAELDSDFELTSLSPYEFLGSDLYLTIEAIAGEPTKKLIKINKGDLDFSTTYPASEVEFKITVLNENLVEPQENYTLELQNDGNTPNFLSAANPSPLITHTIDIDGSSDKTTLSLQAASGFSNPASSAENSEQILGYTLSWTNPVAVNVPALTVQLPLTSTASDDDIAISSSTSDLSIAGDVLTFKTGTDSLSENDSVQFTISVADDDTVELSEQISAALSNVNTTYVNIHGSNNSLSHTITDSDKTELSLTADAGNTTSASESAVTITRYTLEWTNPVDSRVPALAVTLPLTSNASSADFSVEPDAGLTVISATQQYTFKAADTPLTENGSVSFEYTVINDNEVEINETIAAQLTATGDFATYATISADENSLTHEITSTADDDKTTLSFTAGTGYVASADEEDAVAVPYTLSWTNPVASDVPALAASILFTGASEGTDTNCNDSACSDFTLNTLPSGLSRSVNKFTFKAADTALLVNGSITFSAQIINDTLVELNETLSATMQFEDVGSADPLRTYADISSSSFSVAHEIQNTESTEVSISRVTAGTQADENDSPASIAFQLSATKPVDPAVANIAITLPLSGSASSNLGADPNPDYTFTDIDITTHNFSKTGGIYTVHSASDPLIAGNFGFSISVAEDTIVEVNENFQATLTLDSGAPNATLGATTVGHNIINDDFIDITLTTTGTSQSESLTDLVSVFWTGGNTQGLPEIKYALDISGDVSNALGEEDYTLLTLPAIEPNAGVLAANTSGSVVVEVIDDTVIELHEDMDVSLVLDGETDAENDILSEFIRFSTGANPLENSYTYTIENDNDYLDIQPKFTLGTDTDQLLEGGNYNLEVCIPTGYSIQESADPIIISAHATVTGISQGTTLSPADCSNLASCASTNIAITLDSAGFTNGCKTQAVYTIPDNSDYQNKSFNVTLTNGDERCNDGNTCSTGDFVTVINDDQLNLLDTGLTRCVKNGADKRWDVSCSNKNIGSDYEYQDAAETDYYPELLYTYIDATGNPVSEKPADPEAMCFQDNVTGFIWSPSFDLANYPAASSENYCSLDTNQWHVPTVQELFALIDLDPNSDNKPIPSDSENTLNLKKTGDNFWEDTSRYWTSDDCDSQTNGKLTVDFISGHVECMASQSTTNYLIKVYK